MIRLLLLVLVLVLVLSASLKQKIADAQLGKAAPSYEQDLDYPIMCGPASKTVTAGGKTIKIASGVSDLPAGLKKLVKRLLALLDRYDPLDGAKAAQRCDGGARS